MSIERIIAQRQFATERYILSTMPILYLPLWKKDHGESGDSIISSDGHGHKCTATGVLWTPSGGDFNAGTPSYIELASETVMDFTSGDFSIIMRMKFGVIDTIMRPLVRGEPTADGWWFYKPADNTIQFFTAQSGAQQSVTSSTSVTTDIWYTLGFSRSGIGSGAAGASGIVIYINGTNDTPILGNHTDPATCARTLKIGIRDNKTGNPFDGIIQDVLVYNKTLSASAQQHIHNILEWRT